MMSGQAIASRGRSAPHAATSTDVREDEEQFEKQQEIIDLLVAAGYFRARLKGLSPFDKVDILYLNLLCTGQYDEAAD